MALLLFGGPLAVLHEAGLLLVGGWLRVKAAAQVWGRDLRGLMRALGGDAWAAGWRAGATRWRW
jgi:hypothetical protein